MLGGYGEASVLRDTFLDRDVVFKTIRRPHDSDQLLKEMRLIAVARSRHVVEIYDIVSDGTGLVTGIVLEFLPGAAYADVHNLSGDIYLRTLYQIASGLADLHSLGIVHRDLKPENFRDSSSGVLKLFDFGLSNDDVDYRTANNRGTMWYAPPELFRPGAQIAAAIDLYAFGVCAWSLATKALPPELTESPPQRTRQAPRLVERQPLVPGGVSDLVGRCTSPDPSERPTAAECVSILRTCLVDGRQRAVFVDASRKVISEIAGSTPSAGVRAGTAGALRVAYDGGLAVIVSVEGSVYINNHKALPGLRLPASCVVTFGDPEAGSARKFVTFVSSHPEVVV